MFANIWKSKYPAIAFTVISVFTLAVGVKMFIQRDFIQSILNQQIIEPRRILTGDIINHDQSFQLKKRPPPRQPEVSQKKESTAASQKETPPTPRKKPTTQSIKPTTQSIKPKTRSIKPKTQRKKPTTQSIKPKTQSIKPKTRSKKSKKQIQIASADVDKTLKAVRESAILKMVVTKKPTQQKTNGSKVVNAADGITLEDSSISKIVTALEAFHNPNNPAHPVQRFFAESQADRQKKMAAFCSNYTVPNDLNYNKNFIYSDKKSFTYCRVPKVACKTWKKIVGYVEGFFDSPFNVSHKQLYGGKYPYFRDLFESQQQEALQKRIEGFFSFTFSRHPFDRLFSAYRNKIQTPPEGLESYLRNLGPKIVEANKKDPKTQPKKVLNGKEYLDVSFEDFVRFVLTGHNKNPHWNRQTTTCHICKFKFSYLGKFETISRDANQLFDMLDIKIDRLPEDGQYSTEANALMRKYYDALPKGLIDQIYQFYIDDFEAFGYSRHDYF